MYSIPRCYTCYMLQNIQENFLCCVGTWPIQYIVLFMDFCACTNAFLWAPTLSLCLGTSPHPVITYTITIAQYNVSHRPPVIAIYTTHYRRWQYRVKAKLEPNRATAARRRQEAGFHTHGRRAEHRTVAI